MNRFLKGFLALSLLITSTGLMFAACSSGGCGNKGASKGSSVSGCGECGIVNSSSCKDNNVCRETCNDRCDCDGYYFGKSHFSPRSQGLDGARRLSGVVGTHLVDKEEVYYNFDAALAYQRTFDGDKIGKYFSPNCSNCFRMGDDADLNTDVRNSDFGYNGTAKVCICPLVQNFIADFNLFVGFNEWLEGLYAEVQVPVVYTRWDTQCCANPTRIGFEEDQNVWENENLFSVKGDDTVVYNNAKAALTGNTPWGDVPEMCYAKLCCDKQTRVRIADLRFRLGYDFMLKDSYHIGLKAIVAAPTGNKARAYYAFEPIAGNGGHWELGLGLNARASLWEKDEDKTVNWFFDAELTHLFNAKQKRTYDLKPNGVWSRYLLLKEFTKNGENLNVEHPIERGPNVLTQDTKVRVDIQADYTSFFRINYNNLLVDLGYNGWVRSTEKLDYCINIPAKTYGIKGLLDLADEADQTASKSTISKAADADTRDADEKNNAIQIQYINDDGSDIDVCSATHPFALSHSVFAHVGYMWSDIDWEPTIGFGGKAEFSGRANTAFNQWELWLKGNVSF
ncbi:MAG TPA: hypothetical protein VJ201_05800 [Candidatus Babeliales bacterium]|nr:hypothetical protein [Candidatus Babeliales bacterium]